MLCKHYLLPNLFTSFSLLGIVVTFNIYLNVDLCVCLFVCVYVCVCVCVYVLGVFLYGYVCGFCWLQLLMMFPLVFHTYLMTYNLCYTILAATIRSRSHVGYSPCNHISCCVAASLFMLLQLLLRWHMEVYGIVREIIQAFFGTCKGKCNLKEEPKSARKCMYSIRQ